MVLNIPADGQIYPLGQINTQLHIWNTNMPAAQVTNYHITIVNVSHMQAQIQAGHTDSYQPMGNMVYIQNNGPSRLQALW
jgi:hypothetical protein